MTISDRDPVDGFTVERSGGRVALTLSNRYGQSDRYLFDPDDAGRIGEALLIASVQSD